ncbi:MAG TPA: SMC-Scp complex subunit ScpB [Chloroflexota bacterium]
MEESHQPELDDESLISALESILLVAGAPVPLSALASALNTTRGRVSQLLEHRRAHQRGGIRVQVHDGHAQLVTAPENIDWIHRFLGTSKPPALSRSALETLSIVAYRQPVTRPEIEATRGVNSDRAVQTLLSRGLIEERGKRDTLGRPTEYGTTFAFLEYFGLGSLDDLPPLSQAEGETKAGVIGLRSSLSK